MSDAPRGSPSVERQLMFRIAALLVVVSVIMSTFFLFREYQQLETMSDMSEVAAAVSQGVRPDASGVLRLDFPSALGERLARIPDLKIGAWVLGSGQLVAGSTLPIFPLSISSDLAQENVEGDLSFKSPDGSVRFMTTRIASTPVGAVRVALVRGEQTYDDLIDWAWHELSAEALPMLVPLIIGSLATIWFTIRGTLAPVRLLSAEAEAITGDNPEIRLSERVAPIEIRSLVVAVNDALGRLAGALGHQQQFTAYAAHALRTPLAVLQARIDALRADDAIRSLSTDLQRMTRIVGQLLQMARLQAHQVGPRERVDLTELAGKVLADVAPIAHAQGKDVALSAPPGPVFVTGNQAGLEEAVYNLVDNALRYTSEGGTVEVMVSRDATIEVRDDGPGVPEAFKTHVFEPFWSTHGGGAGLGLPIVAQTASLHGGRVSVADNSGGGAVFRIHLPQSS